MLDAPLQATAAHSRSRDSWMTTVPQYYTNAPQFASLAVGSYASCGLLADGTATCWGSGLQVNTMP